MLKKTISIILVTLLSFCLIGCVSDDEFNNLQQRVTDLESKMRSVEGAQNNESITPTKGAEATITQAAKNEFFYYVDGKSAGEIKNEVVQIFNTVPKKGDIFDEFLKRYKVTPLKDAVYGLRVNFFTARYDEYNTDLMRRDGNHPKKDCITSVQLAGLYTEMDGTLGVNDLIIVSVEVILYEYDIASELYDKLYEYLEPEYDTVDNKRETTSWSAEGVKQYTEINNGHTYDRVVFVEMNKERDFFVLKAVHYNRNPNQ